MIDSELLQLEFKIGNRFFTPSPQINFKVIIECSKINFFAPVLWCILKMNIDGSTSTLSDGSFSNKQRVLLVEHNRFKLRNLYNLKLMKKESLSVKVLDDVMSHVWDLHIRFSSLWSLIVEWNNDGDVFGFVKHRFARVSVCVQVFGWLEFSTINLGMIWISAPN